MLKRVLLLAAFVLSGVIYCSAQDIYVVQQFGNNLSNWASGNDEVLKDFDALCSKEKPSIRISDNIIRTLASKHGFTESKSYTWGAYLTCMQKEIDKGITISFSEITPLSKSLIPEKHRNKEDLSFISCRIKINGVSDFDETDLFILKNKKIVSIEKQDISIDKQGNQKLNIGINLDELYPDEYTTSWGVIYNYSKAYPIGFSLYYSYWRFMASLDFSFNLDKDIYSKQKGEIYDPENYKFTRDDYDVKNYIAITPSWYPLRFLSVGCGLGAITMEVTEYSEYKNTITDEAGNVTGGSNGSSVSSGSTKFKFMMRPNVKGFIPCSDNISIALSVSYNWIPGYKDKSGIDFGVGLQFMLDQ